MDMNIKKLYGFTLSEVLIVTAIIGIVAAMTIPAVVANHQKQTLLTLLQKSYAELEQNLTILSTEKYNKGLSSSILCKQTNIAQSAGRFLKEYYDIAVDCSEQSTSCFALTYTSVTNSNSKDFSCSNVGGYNVLLKNGVAICIVPAELEETDDEGNVTENAKDVQVYIDVNGEKKPNVGGRDMFAFKINNKFEIYDENADNCTSSSFGEGCLAKIMGDNWRVNY